MRALQPPKDTDENNFDSRIRRARAVAAAGDAAAAAGCRRGAGQARLRRAQFHRRLHAQRTLRTLAYLSDAVADDARHGRCRHGRGTGCRCDAISRLAIASRIASCAAVMRNMRRCRPRGSCVCRDAVPLEIATALMLQGCTAHYLSHSAFALAPGKSCLVHAAAGGVGQLLTQLAKLRGATVLATAGSAEKAAIAKACGADHVILYRETDFREAVMTHHRRAGRRRRLRRRWQGHHPSKHTQPQKTRPVHQLRRRLGTRRVGRAARARGSGLGFFHASASRRLHRDRGGVARAHGRSFCAITARAG